MVVARTITTLRNNNIVVELRISKTLVEPDIEMIKANATLKDGSILYISEAVGEGCGNIHITGKKKGELIRRWDNSPHHKNCPIFHTMSMKGTMC